MQMLPKILQEILFLVSGNILKENNILLEFVFERFYCCLIKLIFGYFVLICYFSAFLS